MMNQSARALPFARHTLRRLLPMICLTAAGCTVGPDFHPPSQPMPPRWSEPATPPSTQPVTRPAMRPASDLAVWWTTFNDPKLNALIERSLVDNLDLQLAESRIVQARAARVGAAAPLWPDVTAGASASRSRGPGRTSRSQPFFKAGLDASWEIDVFGGTRRSVEAADADIEAAVEDRRDLLVTLISEVALNYIDLRSAQRQVAIAARTLEAQQKTATVTRKQFKGGIASKLDVANADAEAATTRATIPALQASARQTIYQLALLVGVAPNELEAELSQPAEDLRGLPEIPAGLPAELLRRRPDIRRSELQIHAATARIGAATADLFPKFSLTGSFGFQSNALRSLANWDQRTWTIGPGVSWALFDAGRIRANVDVQDALQEQSVLNYRKTVLTAIRDVQAALATCAAEHERRDALVQSLENNRQALELATLRYTSGEAEFLNVLVAQRSLFGAELSLANSDRTLAEGLVALYKALGGGWDAAESMAQNPATRPTTQPAP
jgi:multidrug efflux system outer membrane protein